MKGLVVCIFWWILNLNDKRDPEGKETALSSLGMQAGRQKELQWQKEKKAFSKISSASGFTITSQLFPLHYSFEISILGTKEGNLWMRIERLMFQNERKRFMSIICVSWSYAKSKKTWLYFSDKEISLDFQMPMSGSKILKMFECLACSGFYLAWT